jgi:hypothetical protein
MVVAKQHEREREVAHDFVSIADTPARKIA